jgi:hypothetical protein
MKFCFNKISIILYLIVIVTHHNKASIVDEKTFGSIRCVPYAYADFNADKLVDIYCVCEASNRIEIWVAQESSDPLFVLGKSVNLTEKSYTIVNVVPGDFNGDSIVDMLVVFKNGEETTFQMIMFLGKKASRYENDFGKFNSIFEFEIFSS